MIQFTRADTTGGSIGFVLDAGQVVDSARSEFEYNHCVRVSELLSGGLASEISAKMPPEDFHERTHEGIGTESCLRRDSPMLALLMLLVNDERLFRVVEAVTGCPSIGSFAGRVYRFTPSHDHHDDWHDDLGDDRVVAMSINLSPRPYQGGILQIRDRGSGNVIHQVSNTGLGDGLIFRLAPELQHQVTNVTGDEPRTAFAGWFKTAPDYREMFRPDSRP